MTDRYQIIRLISKDQLGGVYLANDTELERQIAFRNFNTSPTAEPAADWREAFSLHSAKLQALQHPNLLAVHDFAIDEDDAVIISQFVEADTISKSLLEEPLSVIDTVNMALDLLTAMQVAHNFGLIHGALHTGSVKRLPLAHGGYHYLIIDLGIKRLSSIVIGEENHLEDPVLIPPEIFGQPDAATPQSDLFMIGQLCYTALAGGHPYADQSPEQCAANYRKDRMPALDKFASGVPPQLNDWILTLIECNPNDRPASADQALARLHKIELVPPKIKKAPASITTASANQAPTITPPTVQILTPKAVPKKSKFKPKKSTLMVLLSLLILAPTIALIFWFGPMQGGGGSPAKTGSPTSPDVESTDLPTPVEPSNPATEGQPVLLPIKIINTIENRKKPVVVDVSESDTLDWLVTTGAPASSKHQKKTNGHYIQNILACNNIQEFKFIYNPIRIRIGEQNLIPRAATDTQEPQLAKIGQGWEVLLRPPAAHNGPLIVNLYITQWNCDITCEVKDQNNDLTVQLNVPRSTPGVVKIPIKIPNAKARQFFSIKILLASIDAKQGSTMGLNAIQVTKP